MPPQEHPRILPLDLLSQARTIIWIMLAGEALAALLTLAQGPFVDLLQYFGMASFTIQWIALASVAILYAARRHLSYRSPLFVAQAALVVWLLSTWLVTWLAWLTLRGTWLTPQEGWSTFIIKLTGMALIIGLLALAVFQAHWKLRQMVLRAKQAELDALQARIHPHFLFNTLNTGAALVHQQPEKAEQLLLDLADLFRAALAGPRQAPLREELELARRYVEIEQLRFGARMQVEWRLPDTLPALPVPTLSVQPLVENAIHHGVEPSTGVCTLRIAVESDAERVRIIVCNDLPASPASAHRGHHVGLQAVRTRVQAMGGNVEAGVEGKQYRAELVLPRR